MKVRTWQLEMLVVAVVLITVTLLTGAQPVEFLGTAAVLLTFGHAQVADRLAEAEHDRSAYATLDVPYRVKSAAVHCHAWAMRYLVGKEALWLMYFVLHQSWSALAGVGLFLLYPLWRRVWRSRKP